MITQELLKIMLYYDMDTGDFIWKVNRRYIKKGSVAGCLTKEGYIAIKINGKKYRAHRLAHLYVNGWMPTKEIDHKNHIRNDNSWDNISDAVSRGENGRNMSLSRLNTSGACGVSWDGKRGKWEVCMQAEGVKKKIGRFHTLYAAEYSRHAANVKYGFHENHGKPLINT